jgi:Transposase DDE domain group 1
VAVILRPGKTPSGQEVRKLLSRLIGRIRRHWPATHITLRGDSHYGRAEAMTWCETNGVDYIFGLSGNVVLDRLVEPAADDIRVRRAESQTEVLRGFAETRYAAKSWDRERRVVARIEASASHADDMLRRGIDIRYVVTSLKRGDAEHVYATGRPWAGREPDQAAQGAAFVRSHQLPLAARQPDAAHPAHRRVLAAARPARRDPELEPAAPHRVRHDPSAPLEDRRPRHRDREPHSHRTRLMLPGGRGVQPRRTRAATVRTLKQRGGDVPRGPDPFHRQRVDSVLDLTNLPSGGRAEQTNMSGQFRFKSGGRTHKNG